MQFEKEEVGVLDKYYWDMGFKNYFSYVLNHVNIVYFMTV